MADTAARNWLRRGIILLLAVGALVALGWWLTRPEPVVVLVSPVGRGIVEASVANTRAGTVEACQRTRLSTIAGGRIEVLAVKEGDRVSKGQLLMRLWNDDLKAEQAFARAQLATSRSRVNEACTMADLARREARRQQELFEQGFVSTGRLDTANAEAKARAAGCATAKADVAQAQARVEVVGVAEQRSMLVAPFDGTIAKIVGEVGEYSTPSPPGVPTPPAIDLIDDSCLYIQAPMDEVDAPKIRPGQSVRISLDALPGQSFPGTVRRIAPYVTAVEKQARTVEVEAVFDDPKAAGRLLIGYSADIEVILDLRENVLRVPTSALLQGGRVLLLEGGQLIERTVKTGLANWEYTEITDGLNAGDRIVTSLDRDGVKPGAAAVEDSSAKR
ncbi:efflux RND transporter periplasmic adaptor subunit [Piscinibacter sakaiensis]|uniref:efflux RND transporter periplasmic adaptor subunit n=1 Tax=Piscinibacter sakaiensis TaxID=1547922 RepID=UPI003AACA85B